MSLSSFAFAQGVTSRPTEEFLNRQYLFGDWAGKRTELAEEKGITFDFYLYTTLLANPAGGKFTPAGYNRVRGTVDIDLSKLTPTKGLRFHITGLWQNGVNLRERLGTLAVPQADASSPVFRLDSWWLEEDLLHNKVNLFVGQIAGMDFFGLTLPPDTWNYTMDELLYGGNARPNAGSTWDPATTPGAVLKISPTRQIYIQNMIQVGPGCLDPTKPCYRNQYVNDPEGTHFTLNGGGVWNSEAGFLVDPPSGDDRKEKYYPGLYRVGASYTGTKFLNPATNTYSPRNYTVYFMAKQAVWRPVSGSNRGLDVRFSAILSPPDVNMLDKEFIAAASLHGMISKRPMDTIDFGFNDYLISDSYNRHYAASGMPVLTSEKAYEINYSMQVTPWLQLLPAVEVFQDMGGNPKKGTGVYAGISTKVTF